MRCGGNTAPSRLAAMRDDLSGEPRHRLPDHGVVHDPALVEVADELVHPVFAAQRLHPLNAVIGVAEDAHLAVEILVLDALDAGQHLAKRLEAPDVGLAEGPQPLRRLAQKAQEPRLAILTCLRPARRDVYRKG